MNRRLLPPPLSFLVSEWDSTAGTPYRHTQHGGLYIAGVYLHVITVNVSLYIDHNSCHLQLVLTAGNQVRQISQRSISTQSDHGAKSLEIIRLISSFITRRDKQRTISSLPCFHPLN